MTTKIEIDGVKKQIKNCSIDIENTGIHVNDSSDESCFYILPGLRNISKAKNVNIGPLPSDFGLAVIVKDSGYIEFTTDAGKEVKIRHSATKSKK